jgi:hypothetical protein
MSLTFIKVSILFLYLRIFSITNMLKACYVTLVIVIIHGVWLLFSSIFGCLPIASYWNNTLSGKCLPSAASWVVTYSVNIVTNVVIFLLPLPVIGTLNLPRRQKIGVFFVFALGSLYDLLHLSTLCVSTHFGELVSLTECYP